MHSGVCPAGVGPFPKLSRLFLIKSVLQFVARTISQEIYCVVLVVLPGRNLAPI